MIAVPVPDGSPWTFDTMAQARVRMALGAEAKQVSWLILRRGLVHLALGLTLGLAGAFGVGRPRNLRPIKPWTTTFAWDSSY